MIKNFVKILELLGDRLEICVSVYINDANFHYTECGMAELLRESWIVKRYLYMNIRMNKLYKIKINTVFLKKKNYHASSD